MFDEKFDSKKYKESLQAINDISEAKKVPLTAVRQGQNYIFICYSHRDFKQVYSDLADMYDAGVRFWYDEGLAPGEDWDKMLKEKIRDPHCSGIIFYISDNLFISKSIQKEISIAMGYDEWTGEWEAGSIPYFSVNLTEKKPSCILRSILEEIDINSKLLYLLMSTFSDEATYLSFSEKDHAQKLIAAIQNCFNVVNANNFITMVEGM